uniref:S4 n=1 Tax=Borreliella burgdorferi TaxID=139 RepID=O31326_BORBG|nr:s4 [Borreliella burgdorferi N40]
MVLTSYTVSLIIPFTFTIGTMKILKKTNILHSFTYYSIYIRKSAQ